MNKYRIFKGISLFSHKKHRNSKGEHMSFLAPILLFSASVREDTYVNTIDSIVDEMDTRISVAAHRDTDSISNNVAIKRAGSRGALVSHPYFKNKIGCIKDSYVPQE
jgi:hypothetical protein